MAKQRGKRGTQNSIQDQPSLLNVGPQPRSQGAWSIRPYLQLGISDLELNVLLDGVIYECLVLLSYPPPKKTPKLPLPTVTSHPKLQEQPRSTGCDTGERIILPLPPSFSFLPMPSSPNRVCDTSLAGGAAGACSTILAIVLGCLIPRKLHRQASLTLD